MNIIAPSALTARLEAASASLLDNWPVYGETLARYDIISKAETTQTLVFSIPDKFIMVNPDYIAKLGDDQLVYVLAAMAGLIAVSSTRADGCDARVWNIAALYAVNAQLIAQNVIRVGRLPEGSLYDPRMETTDINQIYAILQAGSKVVND